MTKEPDVVLSAPGLQVFKASDGRSLLPQEHAPVPWYCLFTQFGCEFLADAQLRAKGYETVCMRVMKRAHRGGSQWIERPLFRRYLFANSPDGSTRELMINTRVIGVVRTGNEPIEVPVKVIEELRARGDPRGVIPPPSIKSGREYMVINGNPLAGLVALIEQVGGKDAQAWVKGWKVKLPLKDLDPEPVAVMSRGEKARQTRPLEQWRKRRDWEAIE